MWISFVGENMHNYYMTVYRGIFSNNPIFVLHMMLKKRSTDFCAKKIQCLGRVVECFIFIQNRTKKRVFVISDSNYKKTNLGYVKIALKSYCNMMLKKKGQLILVQKKTVFRSCSWMFHFYLKPDQKKVFFIWKLLAWLFIFYLFERQ